MLLGSGKIFISRLIQISIGTVTAAFLARSLGASGYGTVVLMMTIISMLLIPVQFGLRDLIIREIHRSSLDNGFQRWSLLVTVWWSASSSLVLLFLVWNINSPPVRDLWPLICPAVLAMPVLCVFYLLSSILAGNKKPAKEQFVQNILRPLTFLGTLAIMYLWAGRGVMSPGLVFWAYVISFGTAVFLLLHYSQSTLNFQKSRQKILDRGRWRRSLLIFSGIGGGDVILQSFDIIIIGMFMSAEEVGVYRSGVLLGGLMALPLSAISTYVAPFVASAQDEGKTESVQKLCVRTTRYGLLVTTGMLIGAVFAGQWMVNFVFGGEFLESYQVWLVLGIGSFFNVLFGLNKLMLLMTHNEGVVLWVSILSALINIVLNFILIPPFGILGAAVATTIVTIFLNIVLHSKCHRLLGFGLAVFS